MSRWAKAVLAANLVLILLVLVAIAHAQRPPDIDQTGAAFLRVNINPTDVPPMVNVNPFGHVPAVDINKMPEIHIPTVGCENARNYLTGVGRSVPGPLMVTYLQAPAQTTATLSDSCGCHSMTMNVASQVNTAIYLRSGQTLSFSNH